jgi:hypothetical protein
MKSCVRQVPFRAFLSLEMDTTRPPRPAARRRTPHSTPLHSTPPPCHGVRAAPAAGHEETHFACSSWLLPGGARCRARQPSRQQSFWAHANAITALLRLSPINHSHGHRGPTAPTATGGVNLHSSLTLHETGSSSMHAATQTRARSPWLGFKRCSQGKPGSKGKRKNLIQQWQRQVSWPLASANTSSSSAVQCCSCQGITVACMIQGIGRPRIIQNSEHCPE